MTSRQASKRGWVKQRDHEALIVHWTTTHTVPKETLSPALCGFCRRARAMHAPLRGLQSELLTIDEGKGGDTMSGIG